MSKRIEDTLSNLLNERGITNDIYHTKSGKWLIRYWMNDDFGTGYKEIDATSRLIDQEDWIDSPIVC